MDRLRAFLASLPLRWQSFRQWYRSTTRLNQIGAISAAVVVLVIVCAACGSLVTAVGDGGGTTDAITAATSTSRPAGTPQPTATDTATPAPTATDTSIPTLTVTITCAEATDYSFGKVCVHTSPGAALTIEVTYCSGHDAKSGSLGPATADGAGNHTWTWTPDTNCRGTASAFVSASLNGVDGSAVQNFNVN